MRRWTFRPPLGGKIETIAHAEAARRIASGAAIEGVDLAEVRWAALPGGSLNARDCTLTDGDLSDAQLDGAVFERCTFIRCRFSAASLQGSRWTGCVLFDTDKRAGCSFFGAQLDGAVFEGSNLAMCSFESASLHNLTLRGGKASGARFENASFARRMGRKLISAGTLTGCALDLAVFTGLQLDGVDFTESSLRQADFSDCSLLEATFRGSDLSEAVVTGATLDQADFRGATLEGVDLASARSFRGIKVSRSQLPAIAGPLGIRVFPD